MPVINISKFLGINTRTVDAEGNPFYFRDMINFTLSQVWGRLIKRRGYQELLTDLEPEPYAATELIDSNLTRQLVIFESDNKTLSKRVWNGTSYNPRELIDDTSMPSDYEIDIMPFMLTYMNTIYSGAGLNAVNYPFYVQHIKEWVRNTSDSPIIIHQDLYILPANANHSADFFLVALKDSSAYGSGIETGEYSFKVVPIYVDGTFGMPLEVSNKLFIQVTDFIIPSLIIGLAPTVLVNIKALDVFVSFKPSGIIEDAEFPYYFLERVEFDNRVGDKIVSFEGEFRNDSTYGEGFYSSNFDPTLTFSPDGMAAVFTFNGTDYTLQIDNYNYNGGTDAIYFTDPLPVELLDETITIAIHPYWVDDHIRVIYDAYNNKLSTELHTYLNMPAGMQEIPDYRYNLSAIVGNRLFTFRTDSIYAYYSPPDAFNIFTYSNEIVLKDSPVAVINYLDGVLVFSKKRAEFIRVTSAGEVIKEDNFLQFGAISQRSVLSIDSETVFIFSRSGVWRITPRGINKISEFIQGEVQSDVVLNDLSEDEINSCLMGYNQIRRELQLFFKRQDDSNITFVYDIASSTMTGAECWLKFIIDNPIFCSLLNNDSHQLLILDDNSNSLADFNGENPTESVSAEFELKSFDSQLVNKKVRFEKMLIKTNDVSKLNINITYNGVLPVSGALNPKGELYLRAMADDMKVKVTIPTSTGDELYIDKIQIAYKELNR